MLQEVYEWVRPIAEENRIDLELDLQKSLPYVLLDREAIHRCLLNLAMNAIDACVEKYYDNGRGEIIMRTTRPKGWAVEFQVIDNGCGMGKEIKDKVFQCFFSTKGSKGTGLGLMLTKKAIDEHGGVIDLQSEEKKGTKFIIRLPEKNQALI